MRSSMWSASMVRMGRTSVTMAGWQGMLKRRFYDAQILVMPTYREPFGIVFVEAMWAKTVCIGTSIGAIPEIIQNGTTGFLVEPGDCVALSRAIERCLDHPELLQVMGSEGIQAGEGTLVLGSGGAEGGNRNPTGHAEPMRMIRWSAGHQSGEWRRA